MMNDRELLEAAALAAGIVWDHEECGVLYLADPLRPWDPLKDDGDALRLFLALPWMELRTSDVAVTVLERPGPHPPERRDRVLHKFTEWLDAHDGNTAAATRRAIVRAAAAMAPVERPA